MPKFAFKKLIRNKILQKHLDVGHIVAYENVSGTILREKLKTKLHEEADEIPIRDKSDDEIIEEIGDVQQVLDDLKSSYGISDEQVREVMVAKYEKKGGFSDGVYIESVELPETDEWVAYYRKSPDKYPEITDR